jgi:hypothetical protein
VRGYLKGVLGRKGLFVGPPLVQAAALQAGFDRGRSRTSNA